MNGYTVQKASIVKRLMQVANDVVRSEDAKKAAEWKKDVVIRKISEL